MCHFAQGQCHGPYKGLQGPRRYICSYKCNPSIFYLCPSLVPFSNGLKSQLLSRHQGLIQSPAGDSPLALSEVTSGQLLTLPLPQKCSRHSLTSRQIHLLFPLSEMPFLQMSECHLKTSMSSLRPLFQCQRLSQALPDPHTADSDSPMPPPTFHALLSTSAFPTTLVSYLPPAFIPVQMCPDTCELPKSRAKIWSSPSETTCKTVALFLMKVSIAILGY